MKAYICRALYLAVAFVYLLAAYVTAAVLLGPK
jgi:hypothetical protein